jgi:hypothetical protein
MTAAQQRAAARHASTVAGQRNTLQFTVTNQDLPRFAAAITQTAGTIRTAMQKLIADVRTGAQRGLGSTALIGTLQRDNTRLQHLANERVALSNKIKSATQKLSDRRQQSQQEASTVADATRSGFSYTGTQFGDSASLIGSLSSSVAQAGTFEQDLRALRKRHAAKSIVQQLAEAGAGSAGTTAHTLAHSSAADLRHINALNSRLGGYSNTIGHDEARQLYGAGVDSAAGYLHGLLSQDKRIRQAASTLAHSVEDQIRKDLKTHSPSKVLHEVGADTGAGMPAGMLTQVPAVRAAARKLSVAAVPTVRARSAHAAGLNGPLTARMLGSVRITEDNRLDVSDAFVELGNVVGAGRRN